MKKYKIMILKKDMNLLLVKMMVKKFYSLNLQKYNIMENCKIMLF